MLSAVKVTADKKLKRKGKVMMAYHGDMLKNYLRKGEKHFLKCI
jgi:hypothetical protein